MRADDSRQREDAAGVLVGADGDPGDAALSVHQRRGFHSPLQGARTGQAAADGQLPVVDEAGDARPRVFRHAARRAERRSRCRRFRHRSTRTTSANSARGSFIYSAHADQDASIRAANGWDGDRYALVKTPAGDALVWVTVWDTPGDAAEFMSAMDEVMLKRFNMQAARHRRAAALRDAEAHDRDGRARRRRPSRRAVRGRAGRHRARTSSISPRSRSSPR